MAASKQKTNPSLNKGKQEFRKLLSASAKKVDHPLAKYNNAGDLFCVLCNQQVKSDIFWTAHINGRVHKENLIEWKKKKTGLTKPNRPPTPPPVKKKKVETVVQTVLPPEPKKLKSILVNSNSSAKFPATSTSSKPSSVPNDFFDNKSATSNTSTVDLAKPDQDINRVQILPGFSDDEEHHDQPGSMVSQSSISAASGSSHLPADFFDGGVEKPTTSAVEDASVSKSDNPIPEGFFDDPIQDAKARKVEYKNPMDEEWEKFQKVIKEETTVSTALVEEEDEEIKAERQLDEIDQQIYYWTRVDALQRKKEAIGKPEKVNKEQEATPMESDEDEEDLDEFLDWRSKGAWS